MGLSDLWKKEQFERGSDPGDAAEQVNKEVLESGHDMVGKMIGDKYIIEDVLGFGGMGVLYLAKHKVLDRKYVIKIIRLHLMDNQASVAVKRFKREAQALAKVPHRNVVEVVDYDLIDNKTPYFVMEYVQGETLSAFMETHSEGMPLEDFQTIMGQLCEAMAAVHAKNIVHRDLKPTNIMIQETDKGKVIKVLDFGLVHVSAEEFESAILKLTGTGQVIGTPAYMSPEQCRGNTVDHLSDIYAMGLLAYEMLSGSPAVDGDSFIEIIEKQLSERPDPVFKLRNEVPRHVSRAIDKALMKDPKDRFQSSEEFLDALQGRIDTPEPEESAPADSESDKGGDPSRASKSGGKLWLIIVAVVIVAMIVFFALK